MRLGPIPIGQPQALARLGQRRFASASADALDTMLASLETAGKLVCAWFLPLADPDRDLTLNGAAVEGWAAAYGSQKVNLAELTNPPSWDASLFSNKGGVVFDGTNDCLTGTGNVVNWPANTEDLYMLAACRQDNDGAVTPGVRVAFSYGDVATTTSRSIRRHTTSTNSGAGAGSTSMTGPAGFLGAHTVGCQFDIGGSSTVYMDGAAGTPVATAAPALTRTRVRLGANVNASPTLFFQGAIVAAAILNSTATLTDFTDLEALMRARLA